MECSEPPSRSPSFIPSICGMCLGEGRMNLGLFRGCLEASRAAGLDVAEVKGLLEEHRDSGLAGLHRARGLGEELCLGEPEKEPGWASGDTALRPGARGLPPAASPVAWMTLMCCWLSSSPGRRLWGKDTAAAWGRSEGPEGPTSRRPSGAWLPSAEGGLFLLLGEASCVSR